MTKVLTLSFQSVRPLETVGTNVASSHSSRFLCLALAILHFERRSRDGTAYDGGNMTILVTGATGNVGRHVVERLLRAGVHVRALTRNPADANLPDTVEAVQGDLECPDTLPAAFEDVERMYLLPVPATATDVAELAKKAGVRRIVVLSSASAPWEAKYHPRGLYYLLVERAVEDAGFEWTHIRPTGYMLSSLSWAKT